MFAQEKSMNVLLRIIALILMFMSISDLMLLLVGIFPLGSSNVGMLKVNKSLILSRGDNTWVWDYTNSDIKFSLSCPNIQYDSIMRQNGELVAYNTKDNIYDSNHNLIYSILGEQITNSLGEVLGYIHHTSNHIKFSNNNSIIVIATLVGEDWHLNITKEVDLRLYGVYTTYLSYKSMLQGNMDLCDSYFTYTSIFTILGLVFCFLMWVLYRRYLKQRERYSLLR